MSLPALDWKLFTSTFALIFVAELPDKTAFATLLLATRRNPWAIFIGVAAAFCVQSLVAVTFGSLLGLLPESWVHLGAGILFLVFAALMWRRDEAEDEDEAKLSDAPGENRFARTIWTSFVIIFIAEWGDLTQLATASMAARYHSPVTIFASATLALWCVTAVAIFVGHHAKHMIHPRLLQRLAVAAFSAVGIYFIISWARGA